MEGVSQQGRGKAKRILLWIAGAIFVLVVISVISGRDPVAPPAAKPAQVEFIEMPGLGNFAFVAPAQATPDELLSAAKTKCGTTAICSVFAWADRNDVARALPMSDRERAALLFQYSINRNTGAETRLWDCRKFPAKQGADCLS